MLKRLSATTPGVRLLYTVTWHQVWTDLQLLNSWTSHTLLALLVYLLIAWIMGLIDVCLTDPEWGACALSSDWLSVPLPWQRAIVTLCCCLTVSISLQHQLPLQLTDDHCVHCCSAWWGACVCADMGSGLYAASKAIAVSDLIATVTPERRGEYRTGEHGKKHIR